MSLRRISRIRAVTILALGAAVACGSGGEEELQNAESGVTQSDSAAQYTGVWTNWYRHEFDLEKQKVQGLLKILAIRQALTKDNLHDTNGPGGAKLGRSVDCGAETRARRTMDGTCNDPARPTAGAAGARFGRNVELGKIASESDASILSPNPRQISMKLLARDVEQGAPKVKEIGYLNLTAAAWIQFQTHDWFSHPQQTTEVFKVTYGGDTLFIPKSVEDAHDDLPGFPRLRTYKNANTHWWDGSQLYGSHLSTSRRLRSKDGVHFANDSDLVPGGELRLDDGVLPVVDGKEDTGFNDGWWIGLSMLHTLFAREHNAIARTIKAAHPDFSDDKVFDVARMVNAAVTAKIHTVEWTPAVLDNAQLRAGMNLNWHGLSLPGAGARPPILGQPIDPALTEVPYSLTEEFTSVYRMHSLLPENVVLRSLRDGRTETKGIAQTRKGKPDVAAYSMTDLFYSFGQQHPAQLTLHNFPRFLQTLEVPVMGKIDLATIDVLRDRERGVPRYNEFRRQLKLMPIERFQDLFVVPPDGTPAGKSVTGTLTAEHQRYVDELKEVYMRGADGRAISEKEAVERLDLNVGCLAESVRAPGFGFGETQFQVFILMASRRLQADRFYTSDYRPEIYTAEGMEWVEKATMKSVLLRHHPELAGSLAGVENAFFPWKSDPRASGKGK